MSKRPVRALITGFGPFPGVADNISAFVARRLCERVGERLAHVQPVAAVLPTEWDTAPRLLGRLVADLQPALCLHLGVSAGAEGVVVETFARNAAGGRRDAAGRLPASARLVDEAPALLVPGCDPLRLAARATRDGLAVSPSLEAGDYVCNAVHFQSLWLASKAARIGAPGRQVAFVHLPVDLGAMRRREPMRELTMDAALAALLRLFAALLETVTREAPAYAGAAAVPG